MVACHVSKIVIIGNNITFVNGAGIIPMVACCIPIAIVFTVSLFQKFLNAETRFSAYLIAYISEYTFLTFSAFG